MPEDIKQKLKDLARQLSCIQVYIDPEPEEIEAINKSLDIIEENINKIGNLR
jgi:prefoldin subunit 5